MDIPANVTLTGLTVGTIYHYRFLATSQSGLTGGADRMFVTFGVHAATFELLDEKKRRTRRRAGTPMNCEPALPSTGLKTSEGNRSKATKNTRKNSRPEIYGRSSPTFPRA